MAKFIRLNLGLVAILFVLSWTNIALAKGQHIQGTISLPHPIKILMKNKAKFDLTPQQLKRVKTEMIQVYPPKIHSQMDQIIVLEKEVKKAILNQYKSYEDLEIELQEISDLKLKLTETHITALNTLTSILNKQQWQLLQKMLAKHKAKKH